MNKIIIIGYRHFYTLDNIAYPKKYIISSRKAVKYIISRKEYKNVFWDISVLNLIIKYLKIKSLERLILYLLDVKAKKHSIKAFASFSPQGLLENALLYRAKGLKSIQIAHGNGIAMNPKVKAYKKKYKNWDYFFLWSEQQKDNVLKVDPDKKNRIFVIGRPQKTYNLSVKKNESLEKQKILFIGGALLPKKFDVYKVRKNRLQEIMKWANVNNIILYYKPHPMEFKPKFHRSITLAKNVGMKIIGKNTLEKDIAENFDIAITIASSYGQELRLYGIHVIQYDFERYIEDYDYDLTRTGVEYKCKSIGELDQIYRKIINNNVKRKSLDRYFLAS